MKEHSTIFWNIVLYFKILKLPLFFIDLDFSEQHIKVHVSQIKKFLPLDKKSHLSTYGSSTKIKLDQEKLSKLNKEQSPARKSSLGRIASSVVDAVRGSSSKLGLGTESEAGDRDSVQDVHERLSA